MSYTYCNCASAEERLSRALQELAAAIEALPEAPLIAGVVLGGGYGRGEGGVTPAGNLYNDLDFLVMPTEFSQARRIAAALRPLSRKWGEQLHLDVDFFVVSRRCWLARNASTLMLQELLAGHCLVYGCRDFLAEVPRLDWERLPWREGARLMLNRGTGILLARARLKDPAAVDFICRNLHKAVLGCGDALLLVRGEYSRTGDERLARLQTVCADDTVFVQLYSEALQFKYTPQCRPEAAGPERLQQVLHLWLKTLPQLALGVTGRVAVSPRQAIQILLDCGFCGCGYSLLNLLHYVRFLPHSLPLFPLREHPRLKLLLPLVELLETPGCDISGYLRLWQRLN